LRLAFFLVEWRKEGRAIFQRYLSPVRLLRKGRASGGLSLSWVCLISIQRCEIPLISLWLAEVIRAGLGGEGPQE
jgi:hypothetical protein